MWRNADVLDFVGWLRGHNDVVRSPAARVGFYGLDLYSLHASMAAVVDYLAKVDPARPSGRVIVMPASTSTVTILRLTATPHR